MNHYFILEILAAPTDPAPRLIYADWLEERGDDQKVKRLRDENFNPNNLFTRVCENTPSNGGNGDGWGNGGSFGGNNGNGWGNGCHKNGTSTISIGTSTGNGRGNGRGNSMSSAIADLMGDGIGNGMGYGTYSGGGNGGGRSVGVRRSNGNFGQLTVL